MKFNRTAILFLFLCFFVRISFSGTPDWVQNIGISSHYPEQLYLTGFGMAKVTKQSDKGTAMQLASDNAKRNLIEKIRVSINSTNTSHTEEAGDKLSSFFATAVQTSSSLEVQGLQTEPYFDDDDEIYYALAYVKREQLSAEYNEKINSARKQISEHLTAAKKNIIDNSITKALSDYLECYPLFRQIESAQAVLAACGTAFDELEKTVANDEVNVAEVRQEVDKLVKQPMSTPEDVASYIVFCLKNQLEEQNVNLIATPFSFQDTKIGSPFSRYFKQTLENKIVEVAKWNAIQQSVNTAPRTNDINKEFAEKSGAKYILKGNYWVLPGSVKFIATLIQISDGKIMASAEKEVNNTIMEKVPFSLKPENFKEALSDQKEFNKDEVISGGLLLESWTNKGADNLLFEEGDTMQVYLRVNIPCHIRFIYHLASGQRALLENDYYIDESKVNQVYAYPQQFFCDAPYGAEVLQIIARTDKFDPVESQEVDGYTILKEDLQKFLVATRGFKKVKPQSMQVENRLLITTMGK